MISRTTARDLSSVGRSVKGRVYGGIPERDISQTKPLYSHRI